MVVSVTMRMTVAELKEMAKDLQISSTGSKATLFAHICDCGSNCIVRGDSDSSFEY